MPTPSAPDPQTQYAFTSTCPDPDERHEDTRITNNNPTSQQQHNDLSNPIAIPPHFSPNDGLVSDTDAMSSPLSDAAIRNAGVAYDHKPAEDVELDRSQSPYSSSPIEPIQTSRPRQGVGTTSSHLSREESAAYQDPGSEYAMEEDYALPSMGNGFSNRRVRLWPSSGGKNYTVAVLGRTWAYAFHVADYSQLAVVLLARRQSIHWNTAVRATGIRGTGRDQIRRSPRVLPLRLPSNSGYVLSMITR